MITGIIASALSIILKLAGFFMKRAGIEEAKARDWFETTNQINAALGKPAMLYGNDLAQEKDLQAQLDAKYKKDPEVAIRERQNPGKSFKRAENGTIIQDNRRT